MALPTPQYTAPPSVTNSTNDMNSAKNERRRRFFSLRRRWRACRLGGPPRRERLGSCSSQARSRSSSIGLPPRCIKPPLQDLNRRGLVDDRAAAPTSDAALG